MTTSLPNVMTSVFDDLFVLLPCLLTVIKAPKVPRPVASKRSIKFLQHYSIYSVTTTYYSANMACNCGSTCSCTGPQSCTCSTKDCTCSACGVSFEHFTYTHLRMDGLTLPPEITGLLHQFSAFEGKNCIDRQFQGRNVQVILPEGSAAMKRNHRTLLLWQIALERVEFHSLQDFR